MVQSKWVSYCSFDPTIWAPSHLPCKQTLGEVVACPQSSAPHQAAQQHLTVLHKHIL